MCLCVSACSCGSIQGTFCQSPRFRSQSVQLTLVLPSEQSVENPPLPSALYRTKLPTPSNLFLRNRIKSLKICPFGSRPGDLSLFGMECGCLWPPSRKELSLSLQSMWFVLSVLCPLARGAFSNTQRFLNSIAAQHWSTFPFISLFSHVFVVPIICVGLLMPPAQRSLPKMAETNGVVIFSICVCSSNLCFHFLTAKVRTERYLVSSFK